MTEKSAAVKLGLKPDGALGVFRAPPDVAALLGALPDGAKIIENGKGPATPLLLFARDSSELVRDLPRAASALAPGGALWVAFYKSSAKQKTDISRDLIREHAMTLGLQAVGIIAINAHWAALRFKTV
jgi:Protein of unknown function (DUF3052)